MTTPYTHTQTHTRAHAHSLFLAHTLKAWPDHARIGMVRGATSSFSKRQKVQRQTALSVARVSDARAHTHVYTQMHVHTHLHSDARPQTGTLRCARTPCAQKGAAIFVLDGTMLSMLSSDVSLSSCSFFTDFQEGSPEG